MNVIELLPIFIIVVLLFLLVPFLKKGDSAQQQKEKAELAKIQTQVLQAKEQLKSVQTDSSVQLSHGQNEVLDLYERSGIKIQADILEGIVHMNLHERDEIMKYIENQRHYWIQENRKKVYQ